MDWGTKEVVQNEQDATAGVARVELRFPRGKSAYAPSGRVPLTALLALGLGAALGVPAGVLTGVLLGGLSMLLVALIGLLLGAMAAVCGRVLCIVALLELAVVVGGAAVTFAGIGAVPGWIVAWAGRYGKNRSAWAAVFAALPSAVVAFVVVAALPQLAAALVGPADPGDDFAISTLVHLLADPGWMTLALYGLGFLATIAGAGLAAHDTVGQQKFCEPCERYMDEHALPGMTFDVGAWAIDAIRRGGAAEIAPQIPREDGKDVEAKVFVCPACASGFFEAHAHVLLEWPAAKGGTDSRTDQWLSTSIATRAEESRALASAKKVEPTT